MNCCKAIFPVNILITYLYVLLVISLFFLAPYSAVEGSLSASKMKKRRDASKTIANESMDLNHQQHPAMKTGQSVVILLIYSLKSCLFPDLVNLIYFAIHLMQSLWNRFFDLETPPNSDYFSLIDYDGLNLCRRSSVVLPYLCKEGWVSLSRQCLQHQRQYVRHRLKLASVTCIFCRAFFTKTSVDSWNLHAYYGMCL